MRLNESFYIVFIAGFNYTRMYSKQNGSRT